MSENKSIISKSKSGRVNKTIFTEDMKKDYTILVPDMLPIHFNLIISLYKSYGYNMQLLQTSTQSVIDEGLKNVHNDTCYPALLVIGQFMEALKSGKYDVNKTALLISQTGGGCRASNYIALLRKALSTEFPQVPVISLNFSGLEKNPAFAFTPMLVLKLIFAVCYGDMLMLCYNQCRPYEKNKGDTDKVLHKWEERLGRYFAGTRLYSAKKLYNEILDDFAAIPMNREKRKPRVGIVGEIYVKYSPLANNHLEDFLVSEDCEPVVPGLLDFVLYCAVNGANDGKLYDRHDKMTFLYSVGYKVLLAQQKKQIDIIKKHGFFDPPHDFEHLRKCADKYIHQGVKMGEGWLITAEMAALAETGTENIICTQPFGCLPNHIVAKGMSRVIKNAYPDANIVAIDYDPGATKVNQENRIKLMLANAKRD